MHRNSTKVHTTWLAATTTALEKTTTSQKIHLGFSEVTATQIATVTAVEYVHRVAHALDLQEDSIKQSQNPILGVRMKIAYL